MNNINEWLYNIKAKNKTIGKLYKSRFIDLIFKQVNVYGDKSKDSHFNWKSFSKRGDVELVIKTGGSND